MRSYLKIAGILALFSARAIGTEATRQPSRDLQSLRDPGLLIEHITPDMLDSFLQQPPATQATPERTTSSQTPDLEPRTIDVAYQETSGRIISGSTLFKSFPLSKQKEMYYTAMTTQDVGLLRELFKGTELKNLEWATDTITIPLKSKEMINTDMLSYACLMGNMEMVHLIIETGLLKKFLKKQQITIALSNKETAISVRDFLESKRTVQQPVLRPNNWLLDAAIGGNEKIIQIMKEEKINITSYAENAIFFLVSTFGSKSEASLNFLFKLEGVTADFEIEGIPLLTRALLLANLELVQLLIKNGAHSGRQGIDIFSPLGVAALAAIASQDDTFLTLLLPASLTEYRAIAHAVEILADYFIENISQPTLLRTRIAANTDLHMKKLYKLADERSLVKAAKKLPADLHPSPKKISRKQYERETEKTLDAHTRKSYFSEILALCKAMIFPIVVSIAKNKLISRCRRKTITPRPLVAEQPRSLLSQTIRQSINQTAKENESDVDAEKEKEKEREIRFLEEKERRAAAEREAKEKKDRREKIQDVLAQKKARTEKHKARRKNAAAENISAVSANAIEDNQKQAAPEDDQKNNDSVYSEDNPKEDNSEKASARPPSPTPAPSRPARASVVSQNRNAFHAAPAENYFHKKSSADNKPSIQDCYKAALFHVKTLGIILAKEEKFFSQYPIVKELVLLYHLGRQALARKLLHEGLENIGEKSHEKDVLLLTQIQNVIKHQGTELNSKMVLQSINAFAAVAARDFSTLRLPATQFALDTKSIEEIKAIYESQSNPFSSLAEITLPTLQQANDLTIRSDICKNWLTHLILPLVNGIDELREKCSEKQEIQLNTALSLLLSWCGEYGLNINIRRHPIEADFTKSCWDQFRTPVSHRIHTHRITPALIAAFCAKAKKITQESFLVHSVEFLAIRSKDAQRNFEIAKVSLRPSIFSDVKIPGIPDRKLSEEAVHNNTRVIT